MYFVEINYDRSLQTNLGRVAYISHREEQLQGGQTRRLYGIGDRYRALRGDERAIKRSLADDAMGLRRPVFFRVKLTVDNKAAERFARLGPATAERVMRDAVDRLFRGVLRDAQGVYAVHQHGGTNRPAHPHVHALLSPRFRDRTPIHISPARIGKLKDRWEREVVRGLDRQERRLIREPERAATRLKQPWKTRDPRARPRGIEHALDLFWLLRSRTLRRFFPDLQKGPAGPLSVRSPDAELVQNPERVVRRVALNLAAKALPKPLRDALELGRALTRLGR